MGACASAQAPPNEQFDLPEHKGTNQAAEFPNFAGNVYKRPPDYDPTYDRDAKLDPYTVHAYQYASTSRPGMLTPAAIIVAANESDVLLAIKYANEAGIGMAIRSGGHQFWGYSSTGGDNILLDMSNFNNYSYNEETKLCTAGVGLSLTDFTKKLAAMGAFVPHGQCGTVRMGGHLQTGGFSVLAGRSFGFFCDHVVSFTIITADGKKRVVVKPDPENKSREEDKDNDDLWFSVIGGSPGNLGVVLEMVVRPLWDADYPNSRCWNLVMKYTPDCLRACCEFVAKYNDNDDLSADFTLSANILAGSNVFHPNLDSKMMKEHPNLYGPEFPLHPPIISLFACWANLKGGDYTDEAKAFFADMDKATKKYQPTEIEQAEMKLLSAFVGTSMPNMTPDKPHSLSSMTVAFDFPARVEPNPYYSACWCGQSQQLSTNGFAAWAAETTAQVQNRPGCFATFQWCVSGGKHSKMLTNGATNPVALGWRDLKLLCFLYIHYNNTDLVGRPWDAPKKFSEGWVHKINGQAIGPKGIIGTQDRRWMAFPCGPKSDDNLDKTWRYYFDDEAKYLRVLRTKRRVDPNGVFTPNLYCVGATTLNG